MFTIAKFSGCWVILLQLEFISVILLLFAVFFFFFGRILLSCEHLLWFMVKFSQLTHTGYICFYCFICLTSLSLFVDNFSVKILVSWSYYFSFHTIHTRATSLFYLIFYVVFLVFVFCDQSCLIFPVHVILRSSSLFGQFLE